MESTFIQGQLMEIAPRENRVLMRLLMTRGRVKPAESNNPYKQLYGLRLRRKNALETLAAKDGIIEEQKALLEKQERVLRAISTLADQINLLVGSGQPRPTDEAAEQSRSSGQPNQRGFAEIDP